MIVRDLQKINQSLHTMLCAGDENGNLLLNQSVTEEGWEYLRSLGIVVESNKAFIKSMEGSWHYYVLRQRGQRGNW